MRRLLIGIFILLMIGNLAAQTKGNIIGKIATSDGKGFTAATVHLLKASDSSLIKMTASDDQGSFSFDYSTVGKYMILVTASGHAKAYSPVFEFDGIKTIELDLISLKPQSKDLKEVAVVGRKPLIEQKIDRTVINVEAAVSNVGATALEVLEKSPGISVDKDGNISLKGKPGVQVYIDGKPSYLGGAELVNLLKNMMATQLDQIEIMTNPPAKYDAAGNSGIINIRTKKNKARGFNGSVTAGYSQGAYWRTNENLNLNYRNGKYNAFLNYSFNKHNAFQELTIRRTYKKDDAKTIDALFEQVAFMPNSNTSNNLKLGADYFISKNTTIGFVASGFINPEHFRNFNTAFLKDGNAIIDSIVYSTGDMRDSWKNGNLNLNFRHQFDSTGRELTADLDLSKYRSHNRQKFSNTSYDPNWIKKSKTELLSDLPVGIDIYSAKVDYVHPVGKELKLEAGVKSSYVNTDNAAEYFNLVNGNPEVDYNKTNRFLYDENINAAYLNLSKQFKKLGVQAGLRIENTNYKGHQLGNLVKSDSSFAKTYNNLFPTVFFSYNANPKHQFGLSIGRRIDRPAYQDLNPFLFFLDNYTYQAGNPYIRPQYTNNVEFSHTFKSFFTTTLNYSSTKDYMNETFEQNKDTSAADRGYATIVRQGNIGVRQNTGISISAQLTIAKWWSANIYSNFNYNKFKGELYGEQIDIDASNLMFNVSNQLKFEKGWGAELSGFYRTKGVEGQIMIQSFGQISGGVSKQVLKGKGSVRFNIRDMFYSNLIKGNIHFQKTQAYFENKRDSRVGSISFTYRFGKPIKGPQNNRKTGGVSDEQNRVKAGNGN